MVMCSALSGLSGTVELTAEQNSRPGRDDSAHPYYIVLLYYVARGMLRNIAYRTAAIECNHCDLFAPRAMQYAGWEAANQPTVERAARR